MSALSIPYYHWGNWRQARMLQTEPEAVAIPAEVPAHAPSPVRAMLDRSGQGLIATGAQRSAPAARHHPHIACLRRLTQPTRPPLHAVAGLFVPETDMLLLPLFAQRRTLYGAMFATALCACAPNDDVTVHDGAFSERVPQERQPVMPAPQPQPADPSGQPPTIEEDPMDACNANAARIVVGRVATADVIEQARQAAGATLVRTLKPGQMVTMEYRENRLNIDVDAGNVVTNVRCG